MIRMRTSPRSPAGRRDAFFANQSAPFGGFTPRPASAAAALTPSLSYSRPTFGACLDDKNNNGKYDNDNGNRNENI